jgi:aminopeptidase
MEFSVTDSRIRKLALILVDHSIRCQPGDRVLIEATTLAEPLVRELYALILDRGGHPHPVMAFPDQDEIFMAHAGDDQLDFVPTFQQLAYETFEARIRIGSLANTRAMSGVDPARLTRRQKALAQTLQTQMRRGSDGSLKWVTTLYPTNAYAMEAEMSFAEYEDFVYYACHADEETPDPAAYWRSVEEKQRGIIERLQGHNQVILRGPNVDLSLSIRGRIFMNSSGRHNMPDGEVYTGPVEDSVNGWVRYTFPAVYQGKVVEGVTLNFENGKVVKASAEKYEDLLLKMLDIDSGARYLGEFAIGTNFEINRSTKNILFDEKIGGSFHTALGAGYPETGSQNKSQIHWDLICDMKTEAEILVDGEVIYRNGKFLS